MFSFHEKGSKEKTGRGGWLHKKSHSWATSRRKPIAGSGITRYRTQANKVSAKLPFLSYFWLYDTTQTGLTLPKNGTMDSSEACVACAVLCMCECRCCGGHKRESESLEPCHRGSGNQESASALNCWTFSPDLGEKVKVMLFFMKRTDILSL